jgi:YbgC/YbaW family acyl-CoA thioester hydrolase
MSSVPSIEITVMPYHCDANGHVNQAAFLTMCERARWEMLQRGPGMDLFQREGAWAAVRKITAEYHATAHPGDVLRVESNLTHHGRTSFTIHQAIRRDGDLTLVAEAETVFVCVGPGGDPVEVPVAVRALFGTRPSVQAAAVQHRVVRDAATAVDVQGDGPAVLFLHGFPFDRTMWRRLVAPLTGWRRIAPDLRGFGMTDRGDAPATLGVYADDAIQLLDQLDVDRAVVCGLSMGGYVTLDLVRRYPDRVRGVVLANTKATADDPAARAARDVMVRRVETQGTEALADQMIPSLLAPGSAELMPQVVAHLRTMIRSASVEGVIAALRAMRDREDASASLAAIEVPTLVVAGREDQLIPLEEARAMVEAIPDAHLTVIPSSGHLTPLEQPIAMSRVVGEFLSALP